MGLYANADLMEWFKSEWPKQTQTKLDMGKSCIRFKKLDELALEVVGEAIRRVPAKAFIERYQATLRSRGSSGRAAAPG